MISVLRKLLFWVSAMALLGGIIMFALATVTVGYPASASTTDVEYALSGILIPGAFVGFIVWLMLSALLEADVHAQQRRASLRV
jgi:hypothetical protein